MADYANRPWLVPGHMYQYDIGWLVDKILSFETELNTAIDLKTIHYADPIQWDITTQYAPNTVVVDPKTGTAYMSKAAVPSGILLTNTDYWVVIFNYQRIYDKIMSGVAFNDKDNLNASKDLQVNDLVWYGGDLYRCTRAIPEGTTYIPGTNLTPTTIADCLATYYGRDRVAQVLNDTINVSGDYTLNAGDIAETANNVTLHSTKDTLIDADGKLTEQVTGNREIDVDGDDSLHVDGVTSINLGGAVTEVYGSSVDKRVNGAYTESFEDIVTSTFNGKRIVKGKDIDVTAGSAVIHFPNKDVDLANIDAETVSPRDFGASGDGIANDTDAIRKACASGKIVIFDSGVTYLVDGNAGISVSNSIYGNGATIKPTNYSGNVFVVNPSTAADINLSQSQLSNSGVTDSRLFNKTFNIASPINLGNRYGTTTPIYVNTQVVTDGTGKFVSSPLPYSIINGNYICENVHDISLKLTITDLIIDFSELTDASVTVIRITRSNTAVNNIVFYGNSDVTGESRLIFVSRASFIDIGNIYGTTPFTQSGYIIGSFTSCDMFIHDVDCVSAYSNSWGVIGASFINNVTYARCTLNRIDCHYYASSRYLITDSSVQNISIPGGNGIFVVDNSLVFSTSETVSTIYLRPDLPNIWEGKIIIQNCKLSSPSTRQVFEYYMRGSDFNSALDFNNTEIDIRDCIIYCNYAQPITINVSSQSVADKLTVKVVNCNYVLRGTLTGVTMVRFDDLVSDVLWCDNHVPGYCNMPENKAGNVTIDKSSMTDLLIPTASTLKVFNSIFINKNFNGKYTSYMYIGNELRADRALNDSATSKVAIGNIITANTKTHLSEWNAGAT